MPSASVVICTRNRSQLLAGTLESVLADTSRSREEVVVVDNASSDDTGAVVAGFKGVRYVLEARAGHSNARNTGVEAARGDVLVFTDDDVLVEDGWCDAMAAPFDDPAVQVVGGNITPLWGEPPPAWLEHGLAQWLALPRYGDKSRELAAEESPVGACIAFRAAALQGMHPAFSPLLGHRPGLSYGNEEIAVVRQIVSDGGKVWFAANAKVQHIIDGQRLRLPALRRSHFHAGISTARMLATYPGPVKSLREVAIWAVRLGQAARARRSRLTPATAEAECTAARNLGSGVENLLHRWPGLVERVAHAFPS